MKVTITHLKAPWPAGSQPGEVVELPGDDLPAWATGKCTPAADDAEVTAGAAAAAHADAVAKAAAAEAEAQAAAERERIAAEPKGKAAKG